MVVEGRALAVTLRMRQCNTVVVVLGTYMPVAEGLAFNAATQTLSRALKIGAYPLSIPLCPHSSPLAMARGAETRP